MGEWEWYKCCGTSKLTQTEKKRIRIEKERKKKKNYHLNVLNDSCCFVALLCSQAWTDSEMENKMRKKKRENEYENWKCQIKFVIERMQPSIAQPRFYLFFLSYKYNMYAAIFYAFTHFRHINMPGMMKHKIIEILLLRKFRNEITLRQSVCFHHRILESTNQSVSQSEPFVLVHFLHDSSIFNVTTKIDPYNTHKHTNKHGNEYYCFHFAILCIWFEFWCLSCCFDWMKVNDDAAQWKTCLFLKNIRFHGHTAVHWVFVLMQALDSAYYTNEQKNTAILIHMLIDEKKRKNNLGQKKRTTPVASSLTSCKTVNVLTMWMSSQSSILAIEVQEVVRYFHNRRNKRKYHIDSKHKALNSNSSNNWIDSKCFIIVMCIVYVPEEVMVSMSCKREKCTHILIFKM